MLETHKLLLALQELWPAPPPRQHCICLRRDGKAGIEVFLQHPEEPLPVPILFDEDDLDKSIPDILREIGKLLD